MLIVNNNIVLPSNNNVIMFKNISQHLVAQVFQFDIL